MDDVTSVTYNISLYTTPESDEMDALLGLITRSWASLEYQITQMTGTLLGVSEEEARAVFSSMNMRPRLEIAAILAPGRLIYEKDIQTFKSHKAAIGKAQEKRNLLVHGVWGRASDGGVIILQTWGGKDGLQRIEPKIHGMDAAKLDSLAAEIIRAIVDFQNWWHKRPALMPSPYRDE